MKKDTKPIAVIISGLPATGKTSIGKMLSEDFELPFISKDGIKELLFDSLGYKDRECSKKLGKSTYPIMYYFVESELKAQRSFIIESNFDPSFDNDIFTRFKEAYLCDFLIINCITDGQVLYRRFVERADSGERHPGHQDHLNHEEFKESLLSGVSKTLDIGATIINVDTTDFEQVNLIKVKNYIEKHL